MIDYSFWKNRVIFFKEIVSFQVTQLHGVLGVQEPHFWTLCSNYYAGGIKLEVRKDADHKYVIAHTQMIFRAVGVNQLYVQLEYEHNQASYQNLAVFPEDPYSLIQQQNQRNQQNVQQNHSHNHSHNHGHSHQHTDHNHSHKHLWNKKLVIDRYAVEWISLITYT